METLTSFDMARINPALVHLNSGKSSQLNVTERVRDESPTLGAGAAQWAYYSQCDPTWANQELGWCSEYTICTAGCAMTSAAMMLTTKGVGLDPSGLDIWLSDNGGYINGCDVSCHTLWLFINLWFIYFV